MFLFLLLIQGMKTWTQEMQEWTFPKPTSSQLAWQQAELGVLISYDLPVFQGKVYNQAQNRITPIPDPNIFYPDQLDTDQWIRSVKLAGARFAVLTVTHETGFALYQSDVNPYCMKAIRYKEGKGDIVREFVNSCRKYGIEPGLYVGIRWNSFLGVHNFKVAGNDEFATHRQSFYKKMCEGMVRELCTRYGPLFMIWFDGGADDPAKLGPNVLPIVQQYQPNCLFYHNAQKADFRWGGSESGTVPYPCWASFPFPFSHAANQESIYANDFALLKHGAPEGKYWMPAMSDMPLRGENGGHDWFWNPNEEHHLSSLSTLMRCYYQSVGHNSTLIVGVNPDNRGLIPDADVNRLQEWGDSIRKVFANPVAHAKLDGQNWTITIPKGKTFSKIVLQEPIEKGERVRSFVIEEKTKGRWNTIFEGTCIGHKFIKVLEAPSAARILRVRILKSMGAPEISEFVVY